MNKLFSLLLINFFGFIDSSIGANILSNQSHG
jgi:hypothetical protein